MKNLCGVGDTIASHSHGLGIWPPLRRLFIPTSAKSPISVSDPDGDVFVEEGSEVWRIREPELDSSFATGCCGCDLAAAAAAAAAANVGLMGVLGSRENTRLYQLDSAVVDGPEAEGAAEAEGLEAVGVGGWHCGTGLAVERLGLEPLDDGSETLSSCICSRRSWPSLSASSVSCKNTSGHTGGV